MGEVESLALGDLGLESGPGLTLGGVGEQVHDDGALLDGGGDVEEVLAGHPAVLDGLLPRGAVLAHADDDVEAVVAQVEALAVALRAVADEGERVVLEVLLLPSACHPTAPPVKTHLQLLPGPVRPLVDGLLGASKVDGLDAAHRSDRGDPGRHGQRGQRRAGGRGDDGAGGSDAREAQGARETAGGHDEDDGERARARARDRERARMEARDADEGIYKSDTKNDELLRGSRAGVGPSLPGRCRTVRHLFLVPYRPLQLQLIKT